MTEYFLKISHFLFKESVWTVGQDTDKFLKISHFFREKFVCPCGQDTFFMGEVRVD